MAGSLSAEASLAESIPASQQHILGLDTVRAFAALSVVLAHIVGPKLPGVLQGLGLSQGAADFPKYLFTGHPAVIVFLWCLVSAFITHIPAATFQ